MIRLVATYEARLPEALDSQVGQMIEAIDAEEYVVLSTFFAAVAFLLIGTALESDHPRTCERAPFVPGVLCYLGHSFCDFCG